MSYGALIRGNSGQTIIDDVNPCMHIVESGTYGVQGATELVISYSNPINSPYEPYVYVRPNGPHQIYQFRHLGGPGAWTGFAFYQSIFRDTEPPVYGGQWKAAAVMLPRTGGWGLQVFDGQSRVMFDSNREIVRFVGGAQTWSKYAFNPNWPGGMRLQTWAMPYPYEASTYYMVSHFNLKPWFTLEPPRVGFLYSSRTTIFASALVPDETNRPFNWPLIVIA
ncbi:TPA: hypothetical protein L6B58_04715 [Pseudomonas aeruginosa]|nr:hypothetical protein [Pseudomonas aeruginosa]